MSGCEQWGEKKDPSTIVPKFSTQIDVDLSNDACVVFDPSLFPSLRFKRNKAIPRIPSYLGVWQRRCRSQTHHQPSQRIPACLTS